MGLVTHQQASDEVDNDGFLEADGDETSPEDIDLDAPLELLNSVSSRLLKGEIPTNPTRLQSLFQHLQSVVGDVVEASFSKITQALDQMEEANLALVGEAEEAPEGEAYLEEFESGREQIEEGLSFMQETFFSAQNLEELGHFEADFRQAEVLLAEGLNRVETAVAKAEMPALFQVHEASFSSNVEGALDAFASCLDALNQHMQDGNPEHLAHVLDMIDQAREYVEQALDQAEDRLVASEQGEEGE